LHNFWTSFYTSKKYLTLNFINIKSTSQNNNNNKNAKKILSDLFEFEVLVYDQETLNPLTFSKHKYQSDSLSLNKFNQGDTKTDKDERSCDRIFNECSSSNFDACLIKSPGYPGIYLKNSSCSYHINSKNEKLILINDNLQLDGSLCHYDPKTSGQLATSYFCDSGPRSSTQCADFLNIRTIQKNTGTKKQSIIMMNRVCGMGKLPKIITKTDLMLEFKSGSEGVFANHGFLFYAMKTQDYFSNYDLFNQYTKTEIKNSFELNSLKLIEQAEIEHCEWDSNLCVVQIGEDSIDNIYLSSSKVHKNRKKKKRSVNEYSDDDQSSGTDTYNTSNMSFENSDQDTIESNPNDYFRLGYLYGPNQYFSSEYNNNQGLNLRYSLKTNKFNTIAIYVEEFKPLVSNNKLLSENSDCQFNYLSIETQNQLLSK
jgi:hypothetical protein